MIIIGPMPCGVDGCEEEIRLAGDASDWVVTHGVFGEAARCYSTRSLFVDNGYRDWAREVHEYESRLPALA